MIVMVSDKTAGCSLSVHFVGGMFWFPGKQIFASLSFSCVSSRGHLYNVYNVLVLRSGK